MGSTAWRIDCGTLNISRLRRGKLVRQNLAVILGHSRVTVRRRYLDAAFVCCAGLFRLICSSVGGGQHSVSIPFVVSGGEITLNRLNQLRVIAGLFVFLGESEEDWAIRR